MMGRIMMKFLKALKFQLKGIAKITRIGIEKESNHKLVLLSDWLESFEDTQVSQLSSKQTKNYQRVKNFVHENKRNSLTFRADK